MLTEQSNLEVVFPTAQLFVHRKLLLIFKRRSHVLQTNRTVYIFVLTVIEHQVRTVKQVEAIVGIDADGVQERHRASFLLNRIISLLVKNFDEGKNSFFRCKFERNRVLVRFLAP